MEAKKQKKVLILGASSWLGYLLGNKLHQIGYHIAGTVFKSDIVFGYEILVFKPKYNAKSYKKILKEYEPVVIVNFLRGEDQIGLDIHKEVIKWSKKYKSHYVYASSALALDAYDIPLTEDLKAKSVSHYGQFKGKCEDLLRESNISYCILRFASVQGWVRHKATRNQIFIEKLKRNSRIVVNRGVYQNRMLASDLIDGLVDLINDNITGIIHFGTIDKSEEYDFMLKQARIFGFKEAYIESGKKRTVNLAVIPNRIFELYGDKYKFRESETLKGLYEINELKKIAYDC